MTGASLRSMIASITSLNENDMNCGSDPIACSPMLRWSGTRPVAANEAPDTIIAKFNTHPHGEQTSTGPVTSTIMVQVAAPAAR